MEIRVECYAGYRGEETPLRFRTGGAWIGIEQELDRWLSPDHRYFKVLGNDGVIYILRHDSQRWIWELILFRQKAPRQ